MRMDFLSGSSFNSFEPLHLGESELDGVGLQACSDGYAGLGLCDEYGYNFSYSPNLSEQEKFEIKQAMRSISPMIDEFIRAMKIGAYYYSQRMQDLALQICGSLPACNSSNHKHAVLDETLRLIDRLLEKNGSSKAVLAQTNQLFKRVFDLYARFAFCA